VYNVQRATDDRSTIGKQTTMAVKEMIDFTVFLKNIAILF